MIDKLIANAKAEIGYLEKASNSQLDDKTANAGRNNFTKYARDLHNAGYYNGNKNGFAWCTIFVMWLFHQLCNGDKEKALHMTCQTGVLGAGCVYWARYYRNAGRFYKTPKVGDQIFFGTEGKETHTGIVVDVDDSRVYTIEGNTSSSSGVIPNGGAVRNKAYSLLYAQIVGYGRPRYDTTEESPVTEVTEVTETKEETTVNIELEVLKKGAKGEQVKTLQRLLLAMGYEMKSGKKVYGVDGSFGGATEKAVKAFQKAEKLEVDGVVGKNTWTALLK